MPHRPGARTRLLTRFTLIASVTLTASSYSATPRCLHTRHPSSTLPASHTHTHAHRPSPTLPASHTLTHAHPPSPALPSARPSSRRVRTGASPRLTLPSPFPPSDQPSSLVPPGSAADPSSDIPTSGFPVRVMVFIDGSWLYYAFHAGRPRCPVKTAFGSDWALHYTLAIDRLPYLISHSINEQLKKRYRVQRFVEVVRTMVFTSTRADTSSSSFRMQLFRAMEHANFEVHMRTTTGEQEKCIDISLAVEMMHYAAVPGAYDCAVLVSGDQDFMPAMARIRNAGKRVALCSMRYCCSRELVDPASHVRDFDPIWLDEYLDYLLVPRTRALVDTSKDVVQKLLEIIKEHLMLVGGSSKSRNLGRYLQLVQMDDTNALVKLKEMCSLRYFLSGFPEHFDVNFDDAGDAESKNEFIVSLTDPSNAMPQQEEESLLTAKLGRGSADPSEDDDDAYVNAEDDDDNNGVVVRRGGVGVGVGGGGGGGGSGGGSGGVGGDAGDELDERLTVTELRSRLRQLGLPTTGRKLELLERLRAHVSPAEETPAPPVRTSARDPGRGLETSEEAAERALVRVTASVVRDKGGKLSSRDLGRGLARLGLLNALKARHAGLFHFLRKHNHMFRIEMPGFSQGDSSSFEYQVHLLPQPSDANVHAATDVHTDTIARTNADTHSATDTDSAAAEPEAPPDHAPGSSSPLAAPALRDEWGGGGEVANTQPGLVQRDGGRGG